MTLTINERVIVRVRLICRAVSGFGTSMSMTCIPPQAELQMFPKSCCACGKPLWMMHVVCENQSRDALIKGVFSTSHSSTHEAEQLQHTSGRYNLKYYTNVHIQHTIKYYTKLRHQHTPSYIGCLFTFITPFTYTSESWITPPTP